MNNHPLVLISHELPAAWIAALTDRYQVLMGPRTSAGGGLSAELLHALPTAHALLTLLTVKVDAALLDLAPQLKIISQMAVGVDNIDLAACTQRGIPVGHTPGVLTDATADIALTLLLAAARRTKEAAADARAGRWGLWEPTQWLGMELRGSRLGIIGMGAIGAATARRAQAFGMEIVYHSRTAKPQIEKELGATHLSFEQVLATSDIVSLHTPLSAETHHLINAAALAKMQPHAILINTARGAVVDSHALQHALENGIIAAAGLDVTDPEPLPANHPLYQLPNCLILPHLGSATETTRRRMAELACINLLRGLDGLPLQHCANL